VPSLAQIKPHPISTPNEFLLPAPLPAFQHFLSGDRFNDVIKTLVVHESIAVVFTRESFNWLIPRQLCCAVTA
jgi:hypothetical protein